MAPFGVSSRGRGGRPGQWWENDLQSEEGCGNEKREGGAGERSGSPEEERGDRDRSESGGGKRGGRKPRDLPPVVSQRDVWSLRMLVGTPAIRKIKDSYHSTELFELCGIAASRGEKLSQSNIRRMAVARLEHFESSARVTRDALVRNADLLVPVLALSEVERDVLAVSAALCADDFLRTVVEDAGCTSSTHVYAVLAAATGQQPSEVRAALREGGTLHDTGLVRVSWTEYMSPGVPLKLLDSLEDRMMGDFESAQELLRPFFRLAPPGVLTRADVAHLEESVAMVARMLARALEGKRSGINILLHGGPGTGKTELARLLAKELSVPLYEVMDSDGEERVIEERRRLASYGLCQRMLSTGSPALVVFDEAEDVFPRSVNSVFGPIGSRGPGKAWTNRLLESNKAPTIWIGNEIGQIDPAHLRRFAFVLEVGKPPAGLRLRVASERLGPVGVTQAFIGGIAQDERLSPGLVDAAARALELAAPEPGAEADTMAGRILEGSMSLQGKRRPKPILHDGPDYDLSLLNPSEDLELLVRGLARSGRGTVCLYGAPGTGKTAFVHHVAERLGRPMLLRRASDLLNPYVGMTEQLMAEMFREAAEERAVLLLDEADGMLRDRRSARSSWELTHTNEMLTQMESFEGIFFCSTNLVEEIDRAALRRFALKIKLDPPNPDARWRLFLASMKKLGAEEPGEALRRRLDRLDGLTPGDAAAAIRRMHLLGRIPDGDRMIDALEEEVASRDEEGGNAMGFKV